MQYAGHAQQQKARCQHQQGALLHPKAGGEESAGGNSGQMGEPTAPSPGPAQPGLPAAAGPAKAAGNGQTGIRFKPCAQLPQPQEKTDPTADQSQQRKNAGKVS